MASPPRDEESGARGRFSTAALLGAFLLIAAGFVASAVYGEVERGAIDDEVLGIETNSLPSVEHLTTASAALHELEVEVDQYVEQPPEDRAHERKTADGARRDLEHEVGAYLETPMYPGERPLYLELKQAIGALDGRLAETYALAATDPLRARVFAARELRLSVQEVDRALRALDTLNATELHNELTRIAGVRRRTIAHALLLDSACVVFSLGAAFVAVRALRRQRAVERAHEEVLEARANELELFSKRVAHDLLGPLAALSFTLSSVKRNAARGDSIADPLARANACLKRSQRLVDGILDFARAGAAPASVGPADMREAIDGVLEEARADDAARPAIVLERFDDVEVACAPGVLTSVLSNLVRNAVKYVGEGGEAGEPRITLRVTSDADRARVEIEDTGPGLPEGLEAQVFEPYVRAPDNTRPGLGLGLSTVRRFVEGHGGRVGVRSAPGRGCLFWFELPRIAAAPEAPSDRPLPLMQ